MFKLRLEDIVNPDHSLVRLTGVIEWDRLDAELEQHFATVGAAALPRRLMAGLLSLQHELTCDPTSLVKWRQRLE